MGDRRTRRQQRMRLCASCGGHQTPPLCLTFRLGQKNTAARRSGGHGQTQGRGHVRGQVTAHAVRRKVSGTHEHARHRSHVPAHRGGGSGMDVAGGLAGRPRLRVFHFTTWAKARAMQHWIDPSGSSAR
jgi:hypothetical protein